MRLACACCTNAGQRYVEVEELDSGRLEEIESLRFGKEARLYVGEAGVEAIKGIQDPAERYDAQRALGQDSCRRGPRPTQFYPRAIPAAGPGTLSLRLPQKISIFEVDPRDSPDQGNGPGAL